MLKYQIVRECWNEKTYNGYTDNPYWKISWDWYEIGLFDDGRFWNVHGVAFTKKQIQEIKKDLTYILKDCKIKVPVLKHI